jgi:hypothetical protein
MDDDMYALESWLEEQMLEAHNKANLPPRTKGIITEDEKHSYYIQERVYQRVLSRIRSGRISQHPHIKQQP